MKTSNRFSLSCIALALATGIVLAAPEARADAITDWNLKAGELIAESKLGTPPAVRAMAIVQTAAHEAVQALEQRGPAQPAALDAAIAAAHRAALLKLLPAQQAAIDAAFQAALTGVPEGAAKAAALAAGEQAAATVLARRADDVIAPETYRPHTTAGAYVPTAAPAATQWALRKPWLMASTAQFRPAPPPALTSETWVRDFNEVKTLGAKVSARRSAEQTEIARFWEFSLPSIYHGVARSVALQPGRDVARNARLFATVAQAMDDAMISVFEAKYHYNFWRPVTAIRNGDIDANEATERDPSWAPLIDSPLHAEYPSAHSILAGAVGAVVRADVGKGAMPVLATSSPTAKGATRRWGSVEEFMREVASARVYEGIHFRHSTEVGLRMGQQIGDLAVEKLMQSSQ
ncbi:MAG: vanadium-dependent haloperoxidase [Pseudomonadota bacterium]